MEEFKHTALDLEKPAIRLLCLHAGSGSVITSEIFQAELHDRENTVSYEALSYTWGSSHLTAIIYVNGRCLKITHNLYHALLDLRYPNQQRVLWVDAICIDQGDDRERGHQVGQMRDIFKEADRVIFRLGLGSYRTDIFMESLQQLQKESLRHACKSWPRQDSRWRDLWPSSLPHLEPSDYNLMALQRHGLQEILDHPWFRRVWILQEVAFAKAGIISCGTKSVSARLFSLAPLLLDISPDTHCQSVLDIMPSPWKESTWWSGSRSFYKLLSNFGTSEATEPRDLVYALRGMSSDLADRVNGNLFPNYLKPEEILVREVIHYIYGFDLTSISYEAPRPSSMRELVSALPRLNLDICKFLAKTSKSDCMAFMLENSEILVTQEMINTAAQHDKRGEVVEALVRRRSGEFKVDEEVLVSAAQNLDGARQVLEAFWSVQNQHIVTQQILIAAAGNTTSGGSAMEFLLLQKPQGYNITSILEAAAKNKSEYTRAEIIRVLLKQQGNSIAATSELLVAAAEIDYYGAHILKRFIPEKPDFEIAEHAIISAMRNWRGGVDCLKALLHYCPSYVVVTAGIIQAASNSPDKGLNAIQLLLQCPDVRYRLPPGEQFAALTQINDPALIKYLDRGEPLPQDLFEEQQKTKSITGELYYPNF
ncbi:heterokaryon incompatibility protein domain-containing protein [Trichoderma chlorosporum]